jgi:rhodanese-related sulfurtransferase
MTSKTMTSTLRTDPLSATDLRDLLDSASRPRVVDVRTPAEFETVHIPGSYNVPLDIFRARSADVAERLNGDVVLVCRSGQRSTQAQHTLNSAGFTSARVLRDGIEDWQKQGYTVDRGRQRWDLERQVRLVAGSIVLSSIVGSVAAPKLKWIGAAIGAGLTYAALSDTCAMANVLARLPYNRGAATDADAVLARLAVK